MKTVRLAHLTKNNGLLQTFYDTNNVVLSSGLLWAGVLVIDGLGVLMEHHHIFFWNWYTLADPL